MVKGLVVSVVGSFLYVTWQPVTVDVRGEPEVVSYYNLYYGESFRDYPIKIATQDTEYYVVYDSTRDYHFAVTAVDSAGNESGYSEEAIYPPPADTVYYRKDTEPIKILVEYFKLDTLGNYINPTLQWQWRITTDQAWGWYNLNSSFHVAPSDTFLVDTKIDTVYFHTDDLRNYVLFDSTAKVYQGKIDFRARAIYQGNISPWHQTDHPIQLVYAQADTTMIPGTKDIPAGIIRFKVLSQ